MPILSDPIGDLLTRIRNAQKARRLSCRAPWSRIKQELAELLKSEGLITDFKVHGDAPIQDIEIVFASDKPALTLKRVSKPGQRVYSGSKELKPVLRGYGIAILTTSKGLLTDKQARKQKIGGEVLCTIS
jgi:small subunit ribosomal protein S8